MEEIDFELATFLSIESLSDQIAFERDQKSEASEISVEEASFESEEKVEEASFETIEENLDDDIEIRRSKLTVSELEALLTYSDFQDFWDLLEKIKAGETFFDKEQLATIYISAHSKGFDAICIDLLDFM